MDVTLMQADDRDLTTLVTSSPCQSGESFHQELEESGRWPSEAAPRSAPNLQQARLELAIEDREPGPR